jgi:redox-sensitive bicupin YhaK (pirin superfamily)
VGEHPHRGFETVTIVYQGRVAHRDSAGNSGVIGPGDVQWMTAAAGVVHEEKHEREFARAGGTIQMVQLWVNLPRAMKLSAPRYQDIRAEAIPALEARAPRTKPAGGARVRVIAGELEGVRGPARTSSPLELFDVGLGAGVEWNAELPHGHTAAVVVLGGRASVNGSESLEDAELALLDLEGTRVRVRAETETTALLLGGAPLGEPVVAHGPFVMSTGQEIHQAIQDYRSGRMGHLDAP